jgi:hypothetical protein
VCPACQYDLAADRDAAANRSIRWFARLCMAASAAALIAVNRKYDLRLMPIAHQLMAIFLVASLVFYVPLRLVLWKSRRKLWVAATGPGILVMTALYVNTVFRLSAESLGVTSPASVAAATTRPVAGATTLPAIQVTPAVLSMAEEHEPLLRAAREAFTFVRQQGDAIRAECELAGVPKMLTPAALADAKRVAAARQRLKRLHQRLDDYEARVRKSAADVAAKVRSSDAPPTVKERFLAAFGPASEQAIRHATDFIALEHRALGQADAVLALVQSRPGKFDAARGSFASADDQTAYARLRRQLGESSAQEQQMLQRFRLQGNESIDRLQAMLDVHEASAAAAP